MARFRYEASDPDGGLTHGQIDAADQATAARTLQDRGLVPLELAPERRLLPRSRRDDRLPRLISDMSMMLSAGLPLDRALTVLTRTSLPPRIKDALSAMLAEIRAGSSLSTAMAQRGDLFPAHWVAMVQAGEAAGAMDRVLSDLSELELRQARFRATLRGALTYPAVLLFTALLAMTALFSFVVPQLEPLLEGISVPSPMTGVVLWIAAAYRVWIVPVLVGSLVAGLLARLWWATPNGKEAMDRLVLRIPWIGALVRRLDSARALHLLAILMEGGVPADKALEHAQAACRNSVLADALARAAVELKEGQGFAEPLARSGTLPDVAADLVRVGEESGRLAGAIARAATLLQEDADRMITRGTAILVPALTIGLGIVVAVVAGSVVSAVLSVNAAALG